MMALHCFTVFCSCFCSYISVHFPLQNNMDKPHASRASKILNMALEKKENAWGRYINRDNYLENMEHLLKETDEEESCNEPENIGTLSKLLVIPLITSNRILMLILIYNSHC